MKYSQFIKDVYAKPKSKYPAVFKKVDGKPIATRGKVLGAEYKKKFGKKESK